MKPVLIVRCEPDYWSRGHFYEGRKPFIDPTKVWDLSIGTELYAIPKGYAVVPIEPNWDWKDLDVLYDKFWKFDRGQLEAVWSAMVQIAQKEQT